MTPPQDARVRAYKPKSRNGCQTCKARRVKCGEEKPSCARCLKFGVRCEGYVPDFPSLNISKSHSAREILPRTGQELVLLAPSLVRNLVATTTFQNSREYTYFLHFQEEAALEIAGQYDAGLWNRVILQYCQNEPPLSGLVVSLGALNKATRLRALAHYDEEQANSHQQYALSEYGRALKGIHKKISANQGSESIRLILVASLLIYCFENLTGDLDAAVVNMDSALKLLRKQLSYIGRRYRHLETVSPTPAFQDDLVAAFVRIDNAITARFDKLGRQDCRPPDMNTTVLDVNYSDDIFDIPYRFRNIEQARNYHENFLFRSLPSLSRELAVQRNTSPQKIEDHAREMQKFLSAQLRQWNAAFAPLYVEARAPAGGKDFVAVTMLRVQAISTEIAGRKICATGMSSCDSFVPESRVVIRLSKLVMADASFKKTFVFDCGIIPGLFIVVISCRDINIRKEALEVLRELVPRREATWDSLELLKIGERVLLAEEEMAN